MITRCWVFRLVVVDIAGSRTIQICTRMITMAEYGDKDSCRILRPIAITRLGGDILFSSYLTSSLYFIAKLTAGLFTKSLYVSRVLG